MVWAKGAVALGMAAALGAAPAWADSLVVRSSGPSAGSYAPGKKLGDGGSLLLKAGDVVTLLDAKGTRTLRGPGRFSVAAAAATPATNVTMAALLDTKRVRRARTGAVRGAVGEAPAATKRPNLWLVDVAQPGALCVTDPAAVRLWRADAAKPATVRISGGGAQASADFAANEAIAAWPAALPVKDGAAYRIDAGGRSTDIRLALLGAADAGIEGMASALIAKGCQAQLDLLIDTAAR
ncbi:hypothetical protein [Novosphingobium sp. Chol11]|jgi:hypothetical protein|uniref:hypothetical protein n=1 Tax=Novosphingobium sp. Chol11 TaxID=1385763 RepID=UPI000BE279BD|nr:hypothetical protein [Novosphingobium sp. Chol11]